VSAGGRRDLWATLAIVGAFAALAAGRPLARRLARHPTPERCAAMLERYAEQVARARERLPSGRRVPLDAPEVTRCTRDLTDGEVACALAAGWADELERCLPVP
jgi:hypothetical protein